MTDMLEEALQYVRRGWYVFPCREKPGTPFTKDGELVTPPEKTPYVAKGLNDATLDEDQVKAWWTTWKNAMIGINAGKSGLFVIDIDKKHVNGLDTYTQWDINDTAGLKSITPSGGMHIIFTGTGKSTTNGKTGIDTRGEGGYFIAPPSNIIDGEYVGEYKRFNDWSVPPGVIPDGLMSKLFPESTVEYVKGSTTQGTGKKGPSKFTIDFIQFGAEKGDRNRSLFKAAADLAGCGYSQEEAEYFLKKICGEIGLQSWEFHQVLNNAYSKPRTPSIPDSIQQKILENGKDVAGKISHEEQIVMECAVLACMIMDRESIPIIQDILSFTDFRNVKNQIIYKTINMMYNSGRKIDNLTLSDEIAKEVDKVTLDDISRLSSNYYVNSENALAYANIIKEKSSLRKLEALLSDKEKYIKKNIIDSINELEKDVANIAIQSGIRTTAILSAEQAARMVREHTQRLIDGEIEQLKTGFSIYDQQVGGIYSNELIICAARSGDGKSAMALSLINHISLVQKKPTALFSLEMSTRESVCRLVCQLTGIPFRNVYQGKLNDDEWGKYRDAMKRISESDISFDDGFGMTVPELRSKIRKLKEKGIKLIVIDQLEQIKGYEGLPLYVQFDRIAYDIKNITLEFDVPIFLNHQLNRNITDRKLKNPEPQLSDLNQAGEKPANQVWVLSHQKNEEGKILASKVKMLKNRNGPIIEFSVVFVGNRMLFSNPTREEDMRIFHGKDNTDNMSDDPYWANL